MRKYAVFGALMALLSAAGCQVFTAGETIAEPDPVLARAARGGHPAKKHTDATKAKLEAPSGHSGHEHADGHDAHEPPPSHDRANSHAFLGDKERAPAEMATASHILIRYGGALRSAPDVTRTKEQARKLAETVARRAKRRGADFAELANEYTEDPSGKGRGGSLGTFARGRMVPEFDKATFELAPGGTSGVVETAFGFHVIHRDK